MQAVAPCPALSRRVLLRLAFAPIFLSLLTASARAQYAETTDDPFVNLNSAFRAAYADARSELLKTIGPVVVSKGDHLVLFYGGQRMEGKKIGQAYHQLKTVAHVPLAIFVMLDGHDNSPLGAEKRKQLGSYQDLIKKVMLNLDSSGLSEAQVQRQREILSRGQSFIDKVLADGKCSRYDLATFCQSCTPLLMKNTLEAAQVRVEGYHRQMCEWKEQIDSDDWGNLQVVVTGAQMPRRGNLATQYFARLLREPGEGKRIIYAESVFDEPKALNLLGTHRLDASAANIFFGDHLRLHRDLFSDMTPAVLETVDWAKIR